MKAVEGYDGIRAASLGVEPTAIISSNGWKVTSNVLGGAAGLLSIWDGLKKLGEATQASRTGQSLSAKNNMIMGGVGVVGGIASILVIGASAAIGLGVGLFFGILTLLLGYWFITLVAPSVEMWVNRSLIGKHQGQIKKFSDITAEQSSLEMVFQGVVVELSWSHDNPGTNPGGTLGMSSKDMMRTVEQKNDLIKIRLNITLPKLDIMNFDIELIGKESLDPLLSSSYSKENKKRKLTKSAKFGNFNDSNKSAQPDIEEKAQSYHLKWNSDFLKNYIGNKVTFRINFDTQGKRTRSNDVFIMEIN